MRLLLGAVGQLARRSAAGAPAIAAQQQGVRLLHKSAQQPAQDVKGGRSGAAAMFAFAGLGAGAVLGGLYMQSHRAQHAGAGVACEAAREASGTTRGLALAAPLKPRVYRGTVVHSRSLENFEFLENAVLGVDAAGRIAFVGKAADLERLCAQHGFAGCETVELSRWQFLVPGMVDTHIHGAQIDNCGTGYDEQLLEWLKRYTFPTEAKFKDAGYAHKTYTNAVSRLLKGGTTTACYYASIHKDATNILVDIIDAMGQRAYIGKVNMDRHSPDYYIETTEGSIKDTIEFVEGVVARKNPRLTPVITPRFAPTCTAELMAALGRIAHEYNLPVQTHLSENKSEIAWVKELFPDTKTYTEVYDKFGLLTSKTVLAHCIYLSEEEIQLIKARGSGVSHCANSNFAITSGIMHTRSYLEKGLKVGLGTDVSGGYHPSILDAIRQTIIASKAIHFEDPSKAPLSYQEAFFLATLGGSQVLGLESEIGSFEAGKWFDALLVDASVPGGPVHVHDGDSARDAFSKFIFLGDDRNILSVFVAGRDVTPAA